MWPRRRPSKRGLRVQAYGSLILAGLLSVAWVMGSRQAAAEMSAPPAGTGGATSAHGVVRAQAPDSSAPPNQISGGFPASALSSGPAPSLPFANGYSYAPGGRRDPFAVMLPRGGEPKEDLRNLPPLQRVSLSELSLIGIIWGGFGYTAMVQTSDGKGYTVRPGTRLGSNSGVADSITTSAIVIHERLTDVYGNKQTREIVMRLHPKESQE
ncbi:MAG: hypothetical protein E8D45_08180 [Nitrospira sp.]|nr:MAG: hypothetical protein E8D45_08180 [Nitrospira sp.]